MGEHRHCPCVGELQGILIENVHALRTILHGGSSAMACTPKEAWERTLDELRERLRAAVSACSTCGVRFHDQQAMKDHVTSAHVEPDAALTEGGATS